MNHGNSETGCISLRQFHEVASGKYNAGDIKLTSETEIGKANR